MNYMSYIWSGFVFFFLSYAMEEMEPFFKDTAIGIGKNKEDIFYTRGFRVSQGPIQFNGICHGAGPKGSELAKTAALFFRNELHAPESFKSDLCFMETMGIKGDFTSYIKRLFQRAHHHMVDSFKDDRENNYSGVVLTYCNTPLRYLSYAHLATESMIACVGNNEPLCMNLKEGGLEKYAEPSMGDLSEKLPSVVLLGAPQVVDFLFPSIEKCRGRKTREGGSSSSITAQELWRCAIEKQKFSGDYTNCGEFQLLAQ